jgi:hypothetical protein
MAGYIALVLAAAALMVVLYQRRALAAYQQQLGKEPHAPETDNDEIRCRKLTIVGDDGIDRIVLNVNAETEDGPSPLIELFGSDHGDATISIATSRVHGSAICLAGPSGILDHIPVAIRARDEGGMINLDERDGGDVDIVSMQGRSGVFVKNSEEQYVCALLAGSEGEGTLDLLQDGKMRASLHAGFGVDLRDEDNEPVAFLGEQWQGPTPKSGVLRLYGADGQSEVNVSVSPRGGDFIIGRSSEEAKVRLSVDPNGVGKIETT